MGKRVTLKDIAEATNTTIPTVSAALNGTGRISDARREEIARIARDLNYQPHIGAQLLKSKDCSDIGLIVNERMDAVGGSGLFQGLVTAFSTQCTSHEVRGQIEFVDCSIDPESLRIPHIMSGGLVGGLLLTGAVDDRIWKWLRSHTDIPYVIVEEKGDFAVLTDMGYGIRQAVQYLAALGHRTIGLCTGPLKFPPHEQARSCILQASQEYALDINDEWLTEIQHISPRQEIQDGYEWAQTVFASRNYPTAIICNGMQHARSVAWAAALAGLSLPRDLSIVATGAEWEAEKSCPAFTSIEWDHEATMKEALKLLKRRMENTIIADPVIRTVPRFTIRNTTGPCMQNL